MATTARQSPRTAKTAGRPKAAGSRSRTPAARPAKPGRGAATAAAPKGARAGVEGIVEVEAVAVPVERPLRAGPTVAQHMTEHPHTIGQEQPMARAHDMMRKFRIRHLPVLHAGKVVGMVSMRDLHLLETLPDVDPHQTLVEEAMSTDVYEVAPEVLLAEVAETMAEKKLGSAVIVERGVVVGVFTTTDALRALAASLR